MAEKLPPGITKKNGRYRADIMVGRRRLVKTFDEKQDAKNWREKQRSDYNSGDLIDKRNLRNYTVRDVLNKYLKDKKLEYHGHIPSILNSRFIDYTLDKIDPDDIDKWKEGMEDIYAKSTVLKRLCILNAAFNFAIKKMRLKNFTNPASAKKIEYPENADVKRKRRLEEGEWERLIESAEQSPCPDDIWLIKFSVDQATRLSEALSLRWRDIDFQKRVLKLDHTKNEKHRKTKGAEIRPLCTPAIEVLKEKLETYRKPPKQSDFIFHCGASLTVSHRFRSITRRAEIVDFRFHDLRHEAASRLAEKLPYHKLKYVTGHINIKSLDRYYNPRPEDIANEI